MFDKSWLADAGGSVPGWAVSEDGATFPSADAVVFHLPQVLGIPGLRKPPGQLWIGVIAPPGGTPHQSRPQRSRDTR